MSWQDILKESDLLAKVNPKQKKKIKKLLQSSQPTEYMGQDMTKLSSLLSEMKKLDLVKSDKNLQKKFEGFDEKNLDIVSSAAELRKEYETLYRQLRQMVYPKKKGDLQNGVDDE
tara:strand:+ start:821 stop:1165 length:345 start_codon:yes stop_codon:yes gene_type:complete